MCQAGRKTGRFGCRSHENRRKRILPEMKEIKGAVQKRFERIVEGQLFLFANIKNQAENLY